MTHSSLFGRKSPEVQALSAQVQYSPDVGLKINNVDLRNDIQLARVSDKQSFRLIDQLQHHTSIITLTFIFSTLLIVIAAIDDLTATCLSLNTVTNIIFVWLIFRKNFFSKYCYNFYSMTQCCWINICGIPENLLLLNIESNKQRRLAEKMRKQESNSNIMESIHNTNNNNINNINSSINNNSINNNNNGRLGSPQTVHTISHTSPESHSHIVSGHGGGGLVSINSNSPALTPSSGPQISSSKSNSLFEKFKQATKSKSKKNKQNNNNDDNNGYYVQFQDEIQVIE